LLVEVGIKMPVCKSRTKNTKVVTQHRDKW
jgi:hypothetical protein